MTKYFERTCTRMYGLNLVLAWAKAEENLGLKNSLFVSQNGVVIQYIDSDEGEAFHNKLKGVLNSDYFDRVCEKFFTAIELKDLVKIFEILAIFDEIDNYPEIADSDIHRRLERVRKTTESEIYKFNDAPEDFLLFKGVLYRIS